MLVSLATWESRHGYELTWKKLGDQYLDAEMPIDNASGCLRACTLLREQNNSLKIVLSIGAGSVDGSESLSKVAASESARQRFALTAKGLVDAFGLNGVDGK